MAKQRHGCDQYREDGHGQRDWRHAGVSGVLRMFVQEKGKWLGQDWFPLFRISLEFKACARRGRNRTPQAFLCDPVKLQTKRNLCVVAVLGV